MEKGTMTVKDIIEGFNWTDVDFVINKVTEVYFDEDGYSASTSVVVDTTKNIGNIEDYYDLKIRTIEGSGSLNENAVLDLWEDVWQYEEIAKQNKDWTYIA